MKQINLLSYLMFFALLWLSPAMAIETGDLEITIEMMEPTFQQPIASDHEIRLPAEDRTPEGISPGHESSQKEPHPTADGNHRLKDHTDEGNNVGEFGNEEPEFKEPVRDRPFSDEPAIREPRIDHPINEEPIGEPPVIEEPINEPTVIRDPILSEPVR